MIPVVLDNVDWQNFTQIHDWLIANVGTRAPSPTWLSQHLPWAVEYKNDAHRFYFINDQTATLFGFRWMQ